MREARGPAWTKWLASQGVPALSGIDTRSLVLHLRECGAMRAAVVTGEVDVDETIGLARAQPSMEGQSLVADVSTDEPYVLCHEGAARDRKSTRLNSSHRCIS